jgi:hypothetical protein
MSPSEYLKFEEDAPVKRRSGWECETIELDQPLILECLKLTLGMSDIYSGIDPDAPAPPET